MRERRLRTISITGKVRMVRLLCQNILDVPISAVTSQQAEAVYRARTQCQVKRHGKMQPIADATHIKELELTKELWRHARDQAWTYTSPWEGVKPIGKASRGKEQLTTPEARKLHEIVQQAIGGAAIRRRVKGDERPRVLAACLAFYLGMRASEITRRLVVRIVAEDGSIIELRQAKTRKGQRGLNVPAFLAPLLAALRKEAERRGGANAQILPFRPYWVTEQAHRFCDAAGVPRVCAHALRGTMSSLLASRGVPIDEIAGWLGHDEDAKTTTDHYVEPSAAQSAALERGLRVLHGGKR
jgi:integrase